MAQITNWLIKEMIAWLFDHGNCCYLLPSLLVSLLLYDRKLNICGFWSKQDIRGCHLGLLEELIAIFHHFLTFFTDWIENESIKSGKWIRIIIICSNYLNDCREGTYKIQCFHLELDKYVEVNVEVICFRQLYEFNIGLLKEFILGLQNDVIKHITESETIVLIFNHSFLEIIDFIDVVDSFNLSVNNNIKVVRGSWLCEMLKHTGDAHPCSFHWSLWRESTKSPQLNVILLKWSST